VSVCIGDPMGSHGFGFSRVSCACGWDVTDIELCGAAFHSHWSLRVGEWFSTSLVNDLSVRWI